MTIESLPSRAHHRGIRLLVTLTLLAILILAGSLVGERLLSSTATQPHKSLQVHKPSGPFLQAPLNQQQIDALKHMQDHMHYKQLASLYVEQMSLDEELGQLIMVEYNDQSYSDDLNTMITQLHAGGVIMYEFQMLSANQTQHDIQQMQQN